MRILFLPRWYPHRYDPMSGLFIQVQAEALTALCDVAVLYLHEDPDCPNRFEIDRSEENKVLVIRVYYKVPAADASIWTRILKLFRFFRAFYLGMKMLGGFNPQLMHVHVLTRCGVLAYINSIFSGTPYIITEHWSRYFLQNNTYKGIFRKFFTRLVVRKSSAVLPVSEKLKDAMLLCRLNNPNYHVVPNPVDMEIFNIEPDKVKSNGGKRQIIHISCFDDKSKNISGFLRIMKSLSVKREDLFCLMIGEGPDFEGMKTYSNELGLDPQVISFTGVLQKEELVKRINHSDFLVLSSHYETFACVIVEALACGIPVVTTNVGIASEVINEDNGLLAIAGDEKSLEREIEKMLQLSGSFNPKKIRNSVLGKYNAKKVSEQLVGVYKSVISSSSHSEKA
ncbi:MAG: glycosyltransferase [Bacteroidota bacterium]